MEQNLRDMTVGEIASTIPQTTLLFRDKKIDFCCNGGLKLSTYLDQFPSLLQDIERLSTNHSEANEWLSKDIAALIDHIIVDYHEPHRAMLIEMQRLARKVEARHHNHPQLPQGLSTFLVQFSEGLLQHMAKEEEVLFPILRHEPDARPIIPIQVLSEEHHDHKWGLERLRSLAHDFRLPEDACPTWQALYTNLESFIEEIQNHIHLENNILFKRVLER